MKLSEFIQVWKYLLIIPHLVVCQLINKDTRIKILADVHQMNLRCLKKKTLAYYLIYAKPYRNLFYYRVGRFSILLKRILWPYKYFYINHVGSFGGGAFLLNHPYSTIINAKSIGDNFTICHLTTIGNAKHGRNDLIPTIGNNVSIGANVTIIGDIKIGDNVIIGAGSVVVTDIPNNCIIAGNPAKIIKFIDTND